MGAVAFSDEAHAKDDRRGKLAACRLYTHYGYQLIPMEEDEELGIDLHFRYKNIDIWVEAAVQHSNGMFGDLHNFKPKYVSILERKFKYGKSLEEDGIDWYGPNAYLLECNDDLTYAFIIQPCKLNMDYMVTEDRGRGPEDFIMQPKEDFKVVKLI